jgi:hypothetical protein
MVLPRAWRDRLGPLELMETIEVETATQETVRGDVCGPVRIQIEGFRPVHNEVLFVDMKPADGIYEPLVGYLVLEQSQAAVDMLGHRLIHAKHLDLKAIANFRVHIPTALDDTLGMNLFTRRVIERL